MAKISTRAPKQLPKEIPDDNEEPKSFWSSFLSNVNHFRDRLKLGPHHRMERFTIIVSATVSSLLLCTVISFVVHRSDLARAAAVTAMYTNSFEFSLSDQKMYIDGVYGNAKHTDVMVLLRMQDPKGMSANADKYQLFVTGKDTNLTYEPKVTLSLFGSTGYGIVRFQSDQPMDEGVMDITIRANAELSDRNTNPVEDTEDASFSKHDQGRFYVNPGAENVQIVDKLAPGEEDPSKLYVALVADSKDKEIRDQINQQEGELIKLLNRADEYSSRLTAEGYIVPKTPWFVDGDHVDNNGNIVFNSNLNDAFLFDYKHRTIHEGYINQVMEDLSQFDQYMSNHMDNTSDDDKRRETVDRVEQLRNTDGSILQLNKITTGTSPSAQIAAKDSLELLQQTWSSYLSTKSKIQRDYAQQLLILDADVLSQKSGYSKQSTDNKAQFY